MKIDTTCAWCGKAIRRDTHNCKTGMHFCNKTEMGLYYQKHGSAFQPSRTRGCLGNVLVVDGKVYS